MIPNRAVAGALVAVLSRQKLCPSRLLPLGFPPRRSLGEQAAERVKPESPHPRSGPSVRTLSALGREATARAESLLRGDPRCALAVSGLTRNRPSHRFRERPPGAAYLRPRKGGRVVPRGMTQGRGGYLIENLLKNDTRRRTPSAVTSAPPRGKTRRRRFRRRSDPGAGCRPLRRRRPGAA